MSEKNHSQLPFVPRFIRIRDAPFYLGMDKNRFNAEVRPALTEIKIGTQGIAFDRNELDAWADDYVRRVGTPGNQKLEKETWQKNQQGLPKGTVSGTSIKLSKEKDFMKALAQVTSKKRSAT
ncbi:MULTISPECIES: hypothetical protein [unclassified Methylomonas]|uniref:hypothetical protein n=1 Tax=unclassified Methylomonas TaxID=2608980 RepID=UPI00068D9EC1|nr:hypothetical protein [Methylomonas sp. LW13]